MSVGPEYIEAFVKGAEKLISVFGSWPTFHDAEVCGARLDRLGPCLELDIFVFQTSRVTDESGCFKRFNKTVVTFRFSEVEEILLEGFNHQNVLAALTLCNGKKIDVTLHSIFGLDGHFSCQTVEISNVVTLLEEPADDCLTCSHAGNRRSRKPSSPSCPKRTVAGNLAREVYFYGVGGPKLGKSKAEMKLRIAGNPLDRPLVSFLSRRF